MLSSVCFHRCCSGLGEVWHGHQGPRLHEAEGHPCGAQGVRLLRGEAAGRNGVEGCCEDRGAVIYLGYLGLLRFPDVLLVDHLFFSALA